MSRSAQSSTQDRRSPAAKARSIHQNDGHRKQRPQFEKETNSSPSAKTQDEAQLEEFMDSLTDEDLLAEARRDQKGIEDRNPARGLMF